MTSPSERALLLSLIEQLSVKEKAKAKACQRVCRPVATIEHIRTKKFSRMFIRIISTTITHPSHKFFFNFSIYKFSKRSLSHICKQFTAHQFRYHIGSVVSVWIRNIFGGRFSSNCDSEITTTVSCEQSCHSGGRCFP